jgi:hypothetical protein
MLSHKLVFRIQEFHLWPANTKHPQLSLSIITSVLETNKIEPKSYLLFHANVFRAIACFKHSNFFKVNDLDPEPTKLMADPFSRKMANVRRHTQA